jgi:hypothetical protein
MSETQAGSQGHSQSSTVQGPLGLPADLADRIEEIIQRRTDGGGGAGLATEEVMSLIVRNIHTNSIPEPPAESPVVLAHVIAEAIRDLAENSHQHRFAILGVWNPPPPRQPIHPRMAAEFHANITIIAVRCQECGLPLSVTLDGIWTLEQITASARIEGE